ncbi:N-acetylmuramic acid 6-phosphate etherase [hydrothermal vent metagenome]|uniref:N-acetylmuramic acid 6-phosphate etherase n=1 Tax=hydrothermal vent metagenome TaxID=652676 RepID=A0A3B0VEX9_9ZZZZ
MSLTEQFVIGVDGGGSKTAVSILNQHGKILGRGRSGSANYHNVGISQAKANLWTAMEAAATEAGVTVLDATAVTWSLAGVDRPEERQLFEQMAADMLPNIAVHVENDAVSALVGGLGHRKGIVLIAGTGMIAYGENKAGEKARAGGWGPFFDCGSAYDLVQSSLRFCTRHYDERNRSSAKLTAALLAAVGLEKATDLLSWVYADKRHVADVAELAPIVLDAAEKGDIVGLDVVTRGADGLATAVTAVARQLGYTGAFPLVMSGSLLTKSDFYRATVTQAVQTALPQAQPCLSQTDATVGAGLIALESEGIAIQSFVDEETACTERRPGSQAEVAVSPKTIWTSERRNVLTRDLDSHFTETLIGLMHIQDKQAVFSLTPVLPAIAAVVDAVAVRMQSGGRLIYVGAGTSGRLGILDASECPPTFNSDPAQVIGIIAGGMEAVSRSIEGAEDDEAAGANALHQIELQPQDSVVGIAASGRTPYVLGALRAAQMCGALTIAVTCNLPAPIAQAAQHVIAPLVGPELLTGSTRLKAGTAQKLVLNMLSTAVMIRLGKTYGNLMVDVQPTNEKLKARARHIVAAACDIDLDSANTALKISGGDVKVAIVTTLSNLAPSEAQARLVESDGVVGKAIILKG